ncbi:hypothetical protein FT663_01858 [Candidozyma haemuli var. vulneris]|uniref:Hap4 transcription factor heteromerisation domain-containing protein n=1 Tax=Candidozyma haemuli TaxID=45357 RepID=A0A2V1APE8_9ASCO|nr:hypothetical protein CXQ85_003260 [[Candida] haemuloni]KAF3993523.1 hypothetical protein FT663_01858 [[Candida] haemuloni var. vulneris]KAF3993887.1 hypothetical protein FT662_00335 [[Candida] haemuloni var. vulneris]PVH19416.1 hypothetical protein CXQ85_003260 [[Candida] haemuloni]
MNAPPCVPTERRPILTVKTSKNWVLPPRPKNARRARSEKKKDKDKKEKPPVAPQTQPPASSAPQSAPSPVQLKPQKRASLTEPSIASKPSSSAPAPAPVTAPASNPAPVPTTAPTSKSKSEPLSSGPSAAELSSSIGNLDKENYQLKIKLLSLIHDYKRLKSHLMSSPMDPDSPALVDADSPSSTSRKRVFTEVNDPMNELISNMNHLSYRSPSDLSIPEEQELIVESPEDAALDVFNYVNLSDSEDEDDDEYESTSLSRSVSPGCSETDGESSLMTSLTRSTTVSTNNSSMANEKKPNMFKFYDLPAYSDSEYGFSFEPIDPQDKMLSVIEEDHYNQVADFLEEKLLSNDVEYYVEKEVH